MAIVATHGLCLIAFLPKYFCKRKMALFETIQPLFVLSSVALGILVTISSVGAGALGVIALFLLYPEPAVVKIADPNVAHAARLILVADMGHLATGGIGIGVLVLLLCGSLPSIVLASLFAPRLPDRALRSMLARTVAIVAARLLSV